MLEGARGQSKLQHIQFLWNWQRDVSVVCVLCSVYETVTDLEDNSGPDIFEEFMEEWRVVERVQETAVSGRSQDRKEQNW